MMSDRSELSLMNSGKFQVIAFPRLFYLETQKNTGGENGTVVR